MISCHIEESIIEAIKNFRVTYIDGARQTGKTTLIQEIDFIIENNEEKIIAIEVKLLHK